MYVSARIFYASAHICNDDLDIWHARHILPVYVYVACTRLMAFPIPTDLITRICKMYMGEFVFPNMTYSPCKNKHFGLRNKKSDHFLKLSFGCTKVVAP